MLLLRAKNDHPGVACR